MKKKSRVALVVETTGSYGRNILFGVAHYLDIHGDWALFVDERHEITPPPHWLLDWEGDGIITRYLTPDLAAALKHKKIPVVDLNDGYGLLGFSHIGSDMNAIGRMAANHLLEIGLRKIAFVGSSHVAWSRGRLEGVLEAIKGRAEFCGSIEFQPIFYPDYNWVSELERIRDWVMKLPRPIGIVASNDKRAHHILEVCRMQGIAVPDEIAVVGVDNTDFLCELSSPSLSSVIPDGHLIGYEAACLLSRLMSGGALEEPLVIPPKGVASRRSTEVLNTNDPVFTKAIRFMREHAGHGIDIEDVLAEVSISRSTLDRCFQLHLGHSATAELRSIRLKRVKQLLEETDLPMSRIAEIAGFEHPEYMMYQFKRLVGQTPSQWRNSHLPHRINRSTLSR
ncbi:DNA-binding transcriptional regulator [bacterium]|nr:MAG: DNA-binding transcriptional regulator [bacterium]